ncbi:MAG: hypothetical protein HQK58_10340 [Deltaproteobacteria bacterium]|nr:hypothetical protein [Deltaproteobacteria bacterium]
MRTTAQQLEDVDRLIQGLETGQVKSAGMGDRSLVYQDLPDLYRRRDVLHARLMVEQGKSGGFVRVVLKKGRN